MHVDRDHSSFICCSLRRGTSLNLIVLSNIVTRMGGCNVLEDISDDQLKDLAGTLFTGTSHEKTVIPLKCTAVRMCTLTFD